MVLQSGRRGAESHSGLRADSLAAPSARVSAGTFGHGLGQSPQFEHSTQVQFALHEASRRLTANFNCALLTSRPTGGARGPGASPLPGPLCCSRHQIAVPETTTSGMVLVAAITLPPAPAPPTARRS